MSVHIEWAEAGWASVHNQLVDNHTLNQMSPEVEFPADIIGLSIDTGSSMLMVTGTHEQLNVFSHNLRMLTLSHWQLDTNSSITNEIV